VWRPWCANSTSVVCHAHRAPIHDATGIVRGAVDRTDGGDDPGEPALHRSPGVEPAQHRGPRRRSAQRTRIRQSSTEPGGGVGSVRRTHSCSAGRRRHLSGRPRRAGEQADQGRTHPPLPARGTRGVRGLR